jgi:hypothetical protein
LAKIAQRDPGAQQRAAEAAERRRMLALGAKLGIRVWK